MLYVILNKRPLHDLGCSVNKSASGSTHEAQCTVIDKKANNKAKPSACHFQAWHEQRLAKLVVGKQKVW